MLANDGEHGRKVEKNERIPSTVLARSPIHFRALHFVITLLPCICVPEHRVRPKQQAATAEAYAIHKSAAAFLTLYAAYVCVCVCVCVCVREQATPY